MGMMLCVSTNLGSSLTPGAVRAARPGWRDPRLWVGVAIVAASVLVGAQVLGSADRSVAVWAVGSGMGSGDVVEAGDVVARRVRFVDAADADRYLSAEEPLPRGTTLSRDVDAGELLPRSAVGTGPSVSLATLTLGFEGVGVPDGLARGDRVDVFVTSVEKARGATPGPGTAVLRLSDVLVTGLASSADSLAGVGGRRVSIGLPDGTDPEAVAAVVQGAKTDNLYLLRRG